MSRKRNLVWREKRRRKENEGETEGDTWGQPARPTDRQTDVEEAGEAGHTERMKSKKPRGKM